MTLKGIVKSFLDSNGFDGLFDEDVKCACLKEELFTCGEPSEFCEPGYKGPCTCGGGCDFDIYRTQADVEEAKEKWE